MTKQELLTQITGLEALLEERVGVISVGGQPFKTVDPQTNRELTVSQVLDLLEQSGNLGEIFHTSGTAEIVERVNDNGDVVNQLIVTRPAGDKG